MIHFVDLFAVGDPPHIKSEVTDVTIISPEVATLECAVLLGMDNSEIHW